MKAICENCGDECNPEKEEYLYLGAHCNYGKAGSKFTGRYVSDCCNAEMKLQHSGSDEIPPRYIYPRTHNKD